jgi:hypothetical protein
MGAARREEPCPRSGLAQRVLAGLLWVFGVFGLLAIVPTVLPRAWLAIAIRWAEPETRLGLLVEYLARALSAMCFLLGGLLCIAATDVRRYAPMIRWMASFLLGAGLIEAVLLPLTPGAKTLVWLLLAAHGGIIAGFGLAVLLLLRKLPPYGFHQPYAPAATKTLKDSVSPGRDADQTRQEGSFFHR